MAAKNLLSAEMLAVSEQWLAVKGVRVLFEREALIAAMLPMIQRAHQGILDAQRVGEPGAEEKELAELTVKGAETDQLHDRKGRGAWKVLDGLSDLADSPEESAAFIALRDRVMPEGLSILQATWAAESGNAQRVEKELEDEAFSKQLADIALPLKKRATLLDAVKVHAGAGRRLGVIEARRGALEEQAKAAKAAKAGEGAASTSAIVKARNQWIRVANAVLTNIDLIPDLDGEVRSRIVGHYFRVEQVADRRALGRRPVEEPAPEPPPTPANG